MKRKRNKLYYECEAVKLYRSDIDEIVRILKGFGSDPDALTITDDENEFESIDEWRNHDVPGAAMFDLVANAAGVEYLALKFRSDSDPSVALSTQFSPQFSSPSAECQRAFSEIRGILSRRQRGGIRWLLSAVLMMSCLVIVGHTLLSLPNFSTTLWGVSAMVAFGASYLARGLLTPNLIDVVEPKKVGSYWSRNSDVLITSLIKVVLGVVIGAVGILFVQWITAPDSAPAADTP